MLAIEKGILTDTTKQRLEELENLKKDLQEKLITEQSKQQYELSKHKKEHILRNIPKICFYLLEYTANFKQHRT